MKSSIFPGLALILGLAGAGSGQPTLFYLPKGATPPVFSNQEAVFRVSAAMGEVATVAGTGAAGYSGDGGLATAAQLNIPVGVAMDPQGNFYFDDFLNHVVRRVDGTTGIITTVAGTGTAGYSGDGGLATAAQLNEPHSVAFDASGNLYIGDRANYVVRRVDAVTDIITTVAGTGTAGYSGDGGLATAAQMRLMYDLTFDLNGNLLLADAENNRVRKLDTTTGIITTVAGTGTAGYSGDGGLATAAELDFPQGVGVDPSGNLFISDSFNDVVRRVDAATGIITTFAGTGTEGSSGDGGQATDAEFTYPFYITVDGIGDVFICDIGDNRVRKVDAATGIITTVAGTGVAGFSGDGGPAIDAQFNSLGSAIFDLQGNLLIADSLNHRIRQVAEVGVPVQLEPEVIPTFAEWTAILLAASMVGYLYLRRRLVVI